MGQMDFNLSNSLITSLVCIVVVFLVLLVIMIMIKVMGEVTKRTVSEGVPAPVKTAAPAVQPEPIAAKEDNAEVVAAITAVISTMVREPVADIRITKID